MKRILFLIMALSAVIIIYLFIKEQVNNVVLSGVENNILSIVYLVIAACILILARINYLEKNKK